MNETNLNWDDLRLFLAVARQGGLAGAAQQTGKSAPTLGRRILALEKLLAISLFERSAKGYELTSDGKELYERLIAIEKDLEPVLNIADGQPQPQVKVSAGVWVTQYLCSQLNNSGGELSIQFISTNQVLDITHREAVIGIRNSEPVNPSLVRQPLQQVDFAVYATTEHISTWACVLASTPSAKWVQSHAGKEPRIEITDPRNAMDLAMAGVAKAVLPTFIGDTQPALIRVSDPIDALQHQQRFK